MKISVINEFRIGSSAFFEGYDDFKSKDVDILAITDGKIFGKSIMNMKIKGKDIFFMFLEDKSIMLQETLNCGVPMRIGKFLVPQFAEHINLTIDELKTLEPLVDLLDEKHKYEKIIFDAYIENGEFKLTDEQRNEAYKSYKETREGK